MGYLTTSCTNSNVCKMQLHVSSALLVDHVTPFLYSLHWLPIIYRTQFKISLCVFKALNGLAPLYISELLQPKPAPRYNLRSSVNRLLLKYPTFKSLATLGDRSFTCAAPKLWNNLPCDIRNASNLDHFKRLLKTYLFREAYSHYVQLVFLHNCNHTFYC